MAKCNTQAADKARTANNWQTPGASNPGHYRGAWAAMRPMQQYGEVVRALLDGGELADGVDHHLAHARGEAGVNEG